MLDDIPPPPGAERLIALTAPDAPPVAEFDRAEAEGFLCWLDPCADQFTFQTFDDRPTKDKRLARVLNGSLDQHWELLCVLSRKGAGVFVTINRTDLRGRKDSNILAVRAVFADLDGAPLASLKRLSTPPARIYVSSEAASSGENEPTRFHVYWKVDGVERGEFTTIQEQIARVVGSDPAVKDLARVMRLPGFPNNKRATPALVRKISRSGIADDTTAITKHEFLSALKTAAQGRGAAPRGRAPSESVRTALPANCPKVLTVDDTAPFSPDLETAIYEAVTYLHKKFGTLDYYLDWVIVGLTIQRLGWGERGKALFHKLSALSTKYDASGADAKWNDLDKEAPHERPATLRGLFNKALAEGWRATWDSKKAICRFKCDVALREMNARHFIITLAGKTLIGELGRDELGYAGGLMLSTAHDFKLRYENRSISVIGADGRVKPTQLSGYWLKHWNRRQYSGATIAPGKPRDLPDGRLNLWSGYGVEPRQGEWTLMKRHIYGVLAKGEREAAIYLFRWGAWVLQHPGERAEVALVLRGGKGCGKGTFLNALLRCFGIHAQYISRAEHLVGRFNAHFRNCLFLFVDEGYWAGDKQNEGALKALITEPAISIEGKGTNLEQWPNRISVAMASNEKWVVPAGAGERRYAVFDCDDRYVMGQCSNDERKAYFEALHHEMQHGGLEAMLFELLSMPLGGWHPREVYETKALQDQKGESLSPLQEWWESIVQDGSLPDDQNSVRKTGVQGQRGRASGRRAREGRRARAIHHSATIRTVPARTWVHENPSNHLLEETRQRMEFPTASRCAEGLGKAVWHVDLARA